MAVSVLQGRPRELALRKRRRLCTKGKIALHIILFIKTWEVRESTLKRMVLINFIALCKFIIWLKRGCQQVLPLGLQRSLWCLILFNHQASIVWGILNLFLLDSRGPGKSHVRNLGLGLKNHLIWVLSDRILGHHFKRILSISPKIRQLFNLNWSTNRLRSKD